MSSGWRREELHPFRTRVVWHTKTCFRQGMWCDGKAVIQPPKLKQMCIANVKSFRCIRYSWERVSVNERAMLRPVWHHIRCYTSSFPNRKPVGSSQAGIGACISMIFRTWESNSGGLTISYDVLHLYIIIKSVHYVIGASSIMVYSRNKRELICKSGCLSEIIVLSQSISRDTVKPSQQHSLTLLMVLQVRSLQCQSISYFHIRSFGPKKSWWMQSNAWGFRSSMHRHSPILNVQQSWHVF